MDNDAGNNSLVSYSLSGPGAELFSVLDNGAVIFTGGSPENIATLDRELTERYELLVTARDRGNLSSSTYLTIRVEDENDNAPVFQHGPLKVLLPETARPGARVAQVQAIDIDERGTANSKVDYSVTAGRPFQQDITSSTYMFQFSVIKSIVKEASLCVYSCETLITHLAKIF